MGLSIAIAGSIAIFAILVAFTVFPNVGNQIYEIGEAGKIQFENDDVILKTDMDFRILNTVAGDDTGRFFLTNKGNEKLWNFDEFEFLITYDADISGNKKRITERLSYNATAAKIAVPLPDFKIQRGTAIMDAASTTDTITEGVDFDRCDTGNPCFVTLTGTRYYQMGRTTGGTQDLIAHAVYISDISGLTTPGGIIEVERYGTVCTGSSTDCDLRWAWQIIEYTGPAVGDNAINVLTQDTCFFTGTGTTCTGSITPTKNNDKVTVLLTGTSADAAQTNNDVHDNCMFTPDFNASDQPIFTRGHTADEECNIGYVVIEWTGPNWSIERITHLGSTTDPTFETIRDGDDVSRMFIMQATLESGGGSGRDGLCEMGEEVSISASNQLQFTKETHSDGSFGDGTFNEVVYVIYNAETNSGEKIIVNREQPDDQENTSGPEEETWSRAVPTPLTYTDDEVWITGLTTHSDGCGTAHPRGSIIAVYDAANDETDFWQSDSGQEQSYAYEVVELPRTAVPPLSVSEWTIADIQPDHVDPGIINPDETADVWFKLQHPIYNNGFVQVQISTDKGVLAGENTKWYDQSWIYRKGITINSTEVSADLTDFPVLVSITDLDLRDKAQAGGDDILFTASNGTTKLDHEIEKFDVSTGELITWVRISDLSSTIDTEIFMYYGNPNAVNQENTIGVWETDYLGTWHFPSEEFLGVATQAAMDGGNGGWAIFYGNPPIEGDTMNLAIDEDQIGDGERNHTTEQSGYWVFNIENEFDILDTNNEIIGEVGIKRNVDENWTTVNTRNYYLDPVVVATYDLDSSTEPPAVVRIRNADKYSFEVRIQNPGDLTTPTTGDIYYIVMEQGAYSLPGSTSIEAGIVTVTGTNDDSDWSSAQMVQINPINSYTNPVVLGQVVTHNDSRWSNFWTSDGSQGSPPDSSNIYVGKMVAEDTDTARNAEDVGYIIIEQSQGTTNGVDWDAQLGSDSVQGVGDSPPYPYSLTFTEESFLDSTQYNHDGTNFGSINAGGQIGNGKEFDGTSDYVALNMFFSGTNAIPEMTASAWVRVNSGEGDWSILDFDRSEYFTFTISGTVTTADAVGYHTNSATGGGIDDMSSTGLVADGTWHHVQVVYDGTDKIIYIDGVEDTRVLNPYGGNDIGSTATRYGFIGDGSEADVFNGGRNDIYFDGITDDVRFSNVTRSVDWILTEYNNQFSPNSFLTMDFEEEYGLPKG